jgi:hypothetical protein
VAGDEGRHVFDRRLSAHQRASDAGRVKA